MRLLLVGDQDQRRRAKEYAYFLRGQYDGPLPDVEIKLPAFAALVMPGHFPTVPSLETRSDALHLWVDERAPKSKWFQDQLKQLMKETQTCAFFDDGHDEEKQLRRLVFLGSGVNPQSLAEISERAEQLVQDTMDWIDRRRAAPVRMRE